MTSGMGTYSAHILSGWKDIANYLGKGVRTVQRYEEQFRLPVRRPAGRARGSVVATREELDAWVTASPIRKEFQLKSQRNPAGDLAEGLQQGLDQMRALRQQMTDLRSEIRDSLSSLRDSVRAVLDVQSAQMRRFGNMSDENFFNPPNTVSEWIRKHETLLELNDKEVKLSKAN